MRDFYFVHPAKDVFNYNVVIGSGDILAAALTGLF